MVTYKIDSWDGGDTKTLAVFDKMPTEDQIEKVLRNNEDSTDFLYNRGEGTIIALWEDEIDENGEISGQAIRDLTPWMAEIKEAANA